MNKSLVLLGTVSGVIGVLVCAVAGLSRVAGYYYLAGFESTTLFNVGVGAMVFACLLRLEELAAAQR